MSEVRLSLKVENSRLIIRNEGTVSLRHIILSAVRPNTHHTYRPIPIIKPGEEIIADHGAGPSAPPDLDNLGVSFQIGEFKRARKLRGVDNS
jgi:hypothetical protein